ncbi:hypothetical protein C3K47_17330 [Solitalea longa]|uniref:Uncharacterized protein n=1 Tax=Solitalea longa TaxID=2079460 RepID=A0A2S4ZY99_9SPHI|nr:hypothetical protein C3K47_17330 [Solitalea longa]
MFYEKIFFPLLVKLKLVIFLIVLYNLAGFLKLYNLNQIAKELMNKRIDWRNYYLISNGKRFLN